MCRRFYLIVFVALFASVPLAAAQSLASSDNSSAIAAASIHPLTLSQNAQDSASDLHGYMETQFKTAHITPRGLVIADKSVEIQPAIGLTFDLCNQHGPLDSLSATVGVWNSINPSLSDPTGPWFEIDYFARLSAVIARRIDLSAEYVAFESPRTAFTTDQNLQFTLTFDDTNSLLPGVGIRPYARLFYNISGSSTVVVGRNGSTFDMELGASPTVTEHWLPQTPITFSLPTFITVGPKNFWGGEQNVGVFTTSLAATAPVSFLPTRMGRWHVDVSVAYFDLLNGKLVDAAELLGNGRDRSRVVCELGIGVDF